MDKSAIIIGSAGQDVFYLNRLLEARGYNVIGVARGSVSNPPKGCSSPIELADRTAVEDLIGLSLPSEIYYLAAHHRSSEDEIEDTHASLCRSMDVHVTGLLHCLDAIQHRSVETRLFYAASSHIFGDPRTVPQNEETPFDPICPYGITKANGIQICRLYRRDHGLFCSSGILYNHESPRRAPVFIGQKIVKGAVEIKRGERDKLILGDLSAAIDWGAATDYVAAMYRILQLDVADDFVVASGETHTVGEFVATVFSALSLDSSGFVVEKPGMIKKAGRTRQLVGDASKLRRLSGWRPEKSFESLVRELVAAELAAAS